MLLRRTLGFRFHLVLLLLLAACTPYAGKVGADLRFVSSQYLVGDESNQEPKMPAYATVDLHTSYRIVDRVMLFGEIDNLFDARYFTYGTFASLDGLPPSVALNDPRTFTPAPGRAFYVGARVNF